MSTVTPQELLRLWTQEQATLEMMIGHITQHVVEIHTNLAKLSTNVARLQAEVDRLSTSHQTTPSTAATKKPRQKR